MYLRAFLTAFWHVLACSRPIFVDCKLCRSCFVHLSKCLFFASSPHFAPHETFTLAIFHCYHGGAYVAWSNFQCTGHHMYTRHYLTSPDYWPFRGEWWTEKWTLRYDYDLFVAWQRGVRFDLRQGEKHLPWMFVRELFENKMKKTLCFLSYIIFISYLILYYIYILYYIVLYYIILYCWIVLYFLYCIIFYYILLYWLYYIVLYCIIVYYSVLYYIVSLSFFPRPPPLKNQSFDIISAGRWTRNPKHSRRFQSKAKSKKKRRMHIILWLHGLWKLVKLFAKIIASCLTAKLPQLLSYLVFRLHQIFLMPCPNVLISILYITSGFVFAQSFWHLIQPPCSLSNQALSVLACMSSFDDLRALCWAALL